MIEQNLRKVLWVDVFGSGVSVVLALIGPGLIAEWLDVSGWIPFAVGVVLIPWVALLARAVRRERLRAGEVAYIVAGNIGWAIAAAILVFGFPDALSTTGKWIVGLFSLGVLDLGVAEWLGLRALRGKVEAAVV